MATWQPQYLNFRVSNKSHQAIDADYWNALWNTLIAQADNNTSGVKEIFDTFVSGVKGSAETEYRHGDVIITKANVGLGNVDNTADNVKRVAYAEDAGTVNGHTVEANVPASFVFGIRGTSESVYRYGLVIISKSDIGLSNVDNTADNVKRVAYAEDAGTVNGHTVGTDVPADATFITIDDIGTHFDFVFMTDSEVDALFESEDDPTLES